MRKYVYKAPKSNTSSKLVDVQNEKGELPNDNSLSIADLSKQKDKFSKETHMGYIMDLRSLVGSRPLIMVGACVLVIDNEKRVLLQFRKDNECWGLIGGSMELGETLEQVAYREMFEETGLTAKNLKLIHTYSGDAFYYQYPHGDEVYNVVTAFECKEYNGYLRHDRNEATDLQFFSLYDLPQNISPPDRPVLEDYKSKYTQQK